MTTPTTIGRYHIIRPLGSGGMADVYLARDTSLNRDVAVKSPKAEGLSAGVLARFEIEARAVARLEHPAIVPLYEYGEQDGRPYLVMRHMPGGSLADRIARGPLDLRAALPIIERIAAALDYAHANGVLHRDVKPGNILFDETGAAYLSDFGIARITGLGAGQSLTRTGLAIGTAAYMSPEQALGKPIDGRADIYSLGVVIFEMLSGDIPYKADSSLQQAMQHVNAPIPSIRARRPNLPPAVEGVINRALAKDPAGRYQTAAAPAADLRRLATGRQPARTASPFPMWLIVAIAVGALALFAAFMLSGGNNDPPPVARRANSAIEPAEEPIEAISDVAEVTTDGVTPLADTPPMSESAGAGEGQTYSPPAPANGRFEAGSAAPPDDILALVPYSIYYGDIYEDDSRERPWFGSLSPTRLEPVPFQGPEFIINLTAYTCGWPSAGDYTATIEHPDGRMEQAPSHQVDQPESCNLYFGSVMPPVVPGTYTLQFDAFDHMRHSIDVVAPDGPRLYVLHVGNQGATDLFLHNFQPNEAVRVYEYRQEYDMLRLVGWQAHRVDANGQLYLSTRHCISAICQGGPDYYEPSFIVIGDDSGEVREFTQIPTDVRPLQSIVASGPIDADVSTTGPSTFVLGHTDRGTPIEGRRFGNGPQKLLFVGGLTGGYAPATSAVARQAADYLAANPERIPDNLTVIVIPLASPDNPHDPGEHRGRLNGNGVDLNRNWDCEWSADPLWGNELKPGSGGPAPFSEVESRLLRDFILTESPAAAIFWYARANDGLVSPGGCGPAVLVSDEPAAIFAGASGYRSADFGNVPGAVVNGDATNWLDSIGIPAVSVLLPSFTTVDWENNLNGMLALIDAYAARPAATPLPPEVVLGLMASAPEAQPPTAADPSAPSIPPAACDHTPGPWAATLWAAHRARLGCPPAGESRPDSAFQYYEGGTTLWREDLDRIYVLYNDGTYSTHRDDEGPEGYERTPWVKGGFGWLWDNNETVRRRLGQAMAAQANAQQFAAQDFPGGVILTFFDKETFTYVLFDDGAWLEE